MSQELGENGPKSRNLLVSAAQSLLDLHRSIAFRATVVEAHQFPMGTFEEVRGLYDDLNLRTDETRKEFYILPLKDWGEVTASMFATLPKTIRDDTNPSYAAYQVRINDENDFSYHTTAGRYPSLLVMFFVSHSEQEAAFLFPGDNDSQTNWRLSRETHMRYFPEKYSPR